MTCANWSITIFAMIILVLTIWPEIFAVSSKWIVSIAALLVIATVWVGCRCICTEKKRKK